jgi:alpha-aminoadipic semialdehyde synthase
MVTIPGDHLLDRPFKDVSILPGFALEGLANRDALNYAHLYGIGPVDQLTTMFRGTLRYKASQ